MVLEWKHVQDTVCKGVYVQSSCIIDLTLRTMYIAIKCV